jgi:hypothetical protein
VKILLSTMFDRLGMHHPLKMGAERGKNQLRESGSPSIET